MNISPSSIRVALKRLYHEEDNRSEVINTTLDEVFHHYFYRLGHSNHKMFLVVGTLLVSGKVKVEYSNMIERAELYDLRDRLQRRDAEKLFSEFIEFESRSPMEVTFEVDNASYHLTRKISVYHQQNFENLHPGDIIRGICQNVAITDVTILQLNYPAKGIHTGSTPDGRIWFIRRGSDTPNQFFLLPGE